MKMSRTTLKELTKRYHAVLIKCAMLNAVACGLLYCGSALADPVDIVIDSSGNVDPKDYTNSSYIGVNTDDTGNRELGSKVNSIKTSGVVEGDVYGIFSTGVSKYISADAIPGGIDLQSNGHAYGILLESNAESTISGLGNVVVVAASITDKKEAVGIQINGKNTYTINFATGSSITARQTYNLGEGYSYGIKMGGTGTLNVSFSGNGGQAIFATIDVSPETAYSIYAKTGTTNVNFENAILSGKIHNEATLNLTFKNGATWQLKKYDIDSGNFVTQVNLNGGGIDLRDGAIVDVSPITKIVLTDGSTSLLYADVDLANQKMDNLFDTPILGSANLNIGGLSIISEAVLDETKITFTDNDDMLGVVNYTGPSTYKLGGFSYTVSYENGVFTFIKQELPQNDIDADVVNGVFSSLSSNVNSTNTAVNTSLRNRLTNLSKGSVSKGDTQTGQSGGDEDAKYGLWAQAIYSHVKRDQTGSSVGFKGHSEGVVIGGDAEVAENVIAGFAYAYTNSNMKSKGTKSDVDTHGFYAYGQYKPSKWFINGSVGFGLSKADPKGSDKDIKSKFYSVDVMSGYEMSTDFGNLTPAGGLRYVRIEQDSYREDGTTVDAKDANTLTAVAQIGWNNVYKVGNMEVKPKASIGFIYDLESENNKVTVSSAGAKFLTEDGRLKRFGTEVSAGVDTALTNNWNVSFDYTGEFRQHYENHTGTISVRYDF